MELILQAIGDFFGWALAFAAAGLALTGVRIFTPSRSSVGAMFGWLAAIAFGIAGGLVVMCLIFLLGQVHDLTAPAEDVPQPGAVYSTKERSHE